MVCSQKTELIICTIFNTQYLDSIGEIRRVMVPYPPKFEIFTIEATRIKVNLI